MANSNKPWVMKVNSGHATRQSVRIGIISAGKAEVLDGLNEGDLIIPATIPIKEGAKLRARVLQAKVL
jgi:HlyD family secretion protein